MSTEMPPSAALEGPPSGHYGLGGVLSSEWIKLSSVRSTIWTLVITAIAGVGIGALVTSAQAARFSTRSPAARLAFDPTRSSLSGLLFAQLAIGVLGVLVMSAEYSTGTIRATFAAVPRRLLVLVSKVALFAVVVFVVGEVVSFVAFLLGQHILSGKTPTASLSDPTVLRAVVSGGLYLTALGLLALGLATIIRHTAAAISTFVGLLFILPIIADVLPSSFANDVDRFLPADIGTRMLSANYHGADPFGPWLSFAFLGIYAVVILIAGGVLLVRRDA
ncbi:MAG: ABC transporter permease [Actinomycetota bacterium]|nr:ABC transporter permease [Actinomycetota bacterium]